MGMLCFPQLLTGAVSSFPVVRSQRRRVVSLTLPGGDRWRVVDERAGLRELEVHFSYLSEGERRALEEFFEACEGRLRTFVFLEPGKNLLRQSVDLLADAWRREARLAVTGGLLDPFGGTGAFRVVNLGQVVSGLWQELPVPGTYVYCFAVYVRSGRGQMRAWTERAETGQVITGGPAWQRVSLPVSLGDASDPVRFGLFLQPGEALEVFGPQVEAQIQCSEYQPTFDESGLHLEARFDDDRLVLVADGPGLYSGSVRIVSRARV